MIPISQPKLNVQSLGRYVAVAQRCRKELETRSVSSRWTKYRASSPHYTLCYFIHFRKCKRARETIWHGNKAEACSTVYFRSLCSIQCSHILQDFKNLEVDQILIGQDPKVGQDLKKTIRERGAHMNILKRCKFAIKDSKKFDALAKNLVEFNDSLLKMCSERAAEVSSHPLHLRLIVSQWIVVSHMVTCKDNLREHLLERRLESHLPYSGISSEYLLNSSGPTLTSSLRR